MSSIHSLDVEIHSSDVEIHSLVRFPQLVVVSMLVLVTWAVLEVAWFHSQADEESSNLG